MKPTPPPHLQLIRSNGSTRRAPRRRDASGSGTVPPRPRPTYARALAELAALERRDPAAVDVVEDLLASLVKDRPPGPPSYCA